MVKNLLPRFSITVQESSIARLVKILQSNLNQKIGTRTLPFAGRYFWINEKILLEE